MSTYHHCWLESQNHRMVGVGRDLCGSSSPDLLPKQGHLQRAAQDLVQAGLEYLQRRRLHNLPGQPVPGLRHPQREEVLPHVQTELPVPQFVPIAPCPVAGHHWKELGPILLTPTLQIFVIGRVMYTFPKSSCIHWRDALDGDKKRIYFFLLQLLSTDLSRILSL